MPLRGLRRSPFTRPRKDRRESRVRRSSWVRKSVDSNSWPARAMATPLFLIQRLEVLLHLALEVARHLLARDGLLHHLPVLPQHAHVLHARRHLRAAAEHVGVDPLLATRTGLALHAHVERIATQARGGVALRGPALAAARQQPLALREIALVARPALALAAFVPALVAPPVALAPALERLAVPAPLLLGAHLVQRPLHGLHRLVALATLEGFHPFVDVARPIAPPAPRLILPPEPIHLLQQLAQLLRRNLLIGIETAAQGLGLLEHHPGLVLREVALEIRQPVHLLQHPQPVVALLEEGVEIGSAAGQRGVLEDGGEIGRASCRERV